MFDNPAAGIDSTRNRSPTVSTQTAMLPRQVSHVSVKEIDGQTIVLDRSRDKLHELNATAGFIWRCCDGKTTVAEIAAATAREFDADPGMVEPDVAEIIGKLAGMHLIEWTESPDR